MNTSEMPTAPAEGTAPTRSARTRDVRSPARPPTSSDAEGLVLGRYRLGRRLGSGAFASVHQARDERLERDVAIKVLPRERVIGGRFEREARAAARLHHPAIVTLYEAAVDDDGAYLVSELVRGRTLDRLLADGHLSDRAVLRIVVALCDALAHAHEQGVIHRDVKPSNILVPARPASAEHPAKLTDFGVATVVGGDSLTRTGDIVGTAAYMAPEQAEGLEVTPAADLYAVALVAYEGLTGVNPVRHLPISRGGRRLGTYLPPLRRQRRDLPRDLGAGIDRALRPRPRERGTVEDLRHALVAAIPSASDRTGVVAPPWTQTRAPTATAEAAAAPGPEWRDADADATRGAGVRARGTARPLEHHRPHPPRALRGAAAIAAAAAIAWLSTHLLAAPPIAPAAAGLLAGVAVLLVPRIGWVVAVSTLVLLAALQSRAGAGVLVALAAAATIGVLVRRRELWPLPGAAVALALLGPAGAWPALAGISRLGPYRRAALGGAGYLWIAVAGALVGRNLYWLPPHLPVRAVWLGSVQATFGDVLKPILAAEGLAGAAVWAAAALVLPWLIGRRRLLLELPIVTGWALGTVLVLSAVGIHPLHAAAPGAVAAGLVALLPGLRRALRGSGPAPRVP